ncbi:SAM-dependent methyltransferase [Lentzea pudingi]|uniref:SAM-dependent methyltransferase n=1 Tax=Lentzea pudingi TaxID=1789439 RepID=A0ABQ2HKW6_9PSEU|nr:N-6 DNA methylase [Lentzea pudingi]GGM82545.1 SAM-dependent methyltransferase [Lentzea pudingi]
MDETVNAGDIARLADVGRAAVSNWRRRFEDFPAPVGGTASSPLYLLRDVESWLKRNGKPFRVSPAERLWTQLRTHDDLKLGEALAAVEADAATFEFLHERYLEAHSRLLNPTPPEVIEVVLATTDGNTVIDPACGTGSLLKASRAWNKIGQEVDPVSAVIARRRMPAAQIFTGDSLRHNGVQEKADAVVCDPPWHDRAWGHEELLGDARWTYGLPPRGEPELAWLQHCLSLAKPGGLVAVLLPSTAASRRPGKRIRGNLLRAGAVRAVMTVQPGRDLWLLRNPVGRAPEHIALLQAPGPLDPNTRVIDLLDDDVDLSPSRHSGADASAYLAAQPTFVLPPLPELREQAAPPMTTIGELIRAAPGDHVVTSPTGTTYEIDPRKVDPDFLEGVLRAAMARNPTGSTRLDVRRTQVPSLPLAAQQRYGRAFAQLKALEASLEEASGLVRLGYQGLLSGQIEPA